MPISITRIKEYKVLTRTQESVMRKSYSKWLLSNALIEYTRPSSTSAEGWTLDISLAFSRLNYSFIHKLDERNMYKWFSAVIWPLKQSKFSVPSLTLMHSGTLSLLSRYLHCPGSSITTFLQPREYALYKLTTLLVFLSTNTYCSVFASDYGHFYSGRYQSTRIREVSL